MMEIYNEKIRDLLTVGSRKVAQDLLVRDHPKVGAFVDGLKRHAVSSYEMAQNVLDAGMAERAITATEMNTTSSRAHTIVQVWQ